MTVSKGPTHEQRPLSGERSCALPLKSTEGATQPEDLQDTKALQQVCLSVEGPGYGIENGHWCDRGIWEWGQPRTALNRQRTGVCPVQKGTEEGTALFTSLDGRNLKIGVLARELWER